MLSLIPRGSFGLVRLRTDLIPLAAMLLAATVACGSPSDEDPVSSPITAGPTIADLKPTATSTTPPTQAIAPAATATPDLTFAPTDERRALRFRELEGWETDFDQKLVGLEEFISVVGRDAIDPIDEPTFASVSNAPYYMKAREPVIAVEVDGDARAYPLAMLMWHELVNDTVGGVPVAVTFCPLCNTAITFNRVVDGQELTFGTTGKVRNSDLVMWDRQTQSWWQQITGEALVGHYAAERAELEVINSPIIAWETFVEQFPDGLVLERLFDEFGFPAKSYDLAPYAGYDSIDASPFLFDGETDGRYPPNTRVLTVELEDAIVAYPFSFLEDAVVLNDAIGETEVVAFFDNGTLSAFFDFLDQQLTSGSTTLFSREVDGEILTFDLTENGVQDIQTGSTWNLLGTAIAGELAGARLEPIVHANHFWFAWAVFRPESEVRDALDEVTGPVSAALSG